MWPVVNPAQLAGDFIHAQFLHNEKYTIKRGDCQDIIRENVQTKTKTFLNLLNFNSK